MEKLSLLVVFVQATNDSSLYTNVEVLDSAERARKKIANNHWVASDKGSILDIDAAREADAVGAEAVGIAAVRVGVVAGAAAVVGLVAGIAVGALFGSKYCRSSTRA